MEPIRIELPTGLQVGNVNVYLFTRPEPLLVDTGLKSPASWQALREGLAGHGMHVHDLSRVIITHAHVDHFGQAGTILADSAAELWISELGAPWLLETEPEFERRQTYYRDYFLKESGLSAQESELVLSGFEAMMRQADPIPAERIRTFRIDGLLQMGGKRWQVLHAPGHASMQTCFYQAETKQLISADMLLATTPVPIVETPPQGETRHVPALPLFIKSLTKLETMNIDEVLPGHGRPFRDHRQLIQRQKARIRQRMEECLNLIRAGYQVRNELVNQMYAHFPVEARFAGLWMLTGYLDLLEEEGAINQRSVDGVYHYSAVE